jgi:hypothetical protein
MFEHVAWNTSCVLLRIILHTTQTLQLITINIKTEIILKSY